MREDAMTEERLVLAELLEKAGDGDFLRAVAEAVAQWLPRPQPRHPARRLAIAHPKAAPGQLFPAISGSPQELREGAGRGDPGGLDRRRVDPPGRRSGAGDGANRHQQVASIQAVSCASR